MGSGRGLVAFGDELPGSAGDRFRSEIIHQRQSVFAIRSPDPGHGKTGLVEF